MYDVFYGATLFNLLNGYSPSGETFYLDVYGNGVVAGGFNVEAIPDASRATTSVSTFWQLCADMSCDETGIGVSYGDTVYITNGYLSASARRQLQHSDAPSEAEGSEPPSEAGYGQLTQPRPVGSRSLRHSHT